jgi:hypothetical protein
MERDAMVELTLKRRAAGLFPDEGGTHAPGPRTRGGRRE